MKSVLLDELIEFSGNPMSENTLREAKRISGLFESALFYPKKSSLLPDVKEVSDEFEECYFIFSDDKIITLERNLESDVFKTTVRYLTDIRAFTLHQNHSSTRSILRLNFQDEEEIKLDSDIDCNEHWREKFKLLIDDISEKLIQA